jgi:Uma2 family endonuclease
MNVQLPLRFDKPAFIEWVQRQEGRYELVNGRVVMMVGATRRHGIMIRNLIVAITNQLDPREWMVISEFGLDLGPDTLRYPDILIDRAGGNPGDYVANEPVLAIEVLSPSSTAVDLGDKVSEYLTLPSLSTYVVFAQDEPKAWIWSRVEGAFAATPAVITGTDKLIHMSALNIALPFAAAYANTGLA